MRKRTNNRWRLWAIALAAMPLAMVPAALYKTSPAEAMDSPKARAAQVLSAADTARLHYVHSSGSLLLDEGSASGTLPGKMRAKVNITATISGTFTIYIHGGTITGHGSATPHGSGTYESFSGSLTVTGGSGRYSHARGHAGLYGTFDRNNYALVVQTTGTLHY